jgi:hypothetical protein
MLHHLTQPMVAASRRWRKTAGWLSVCLLTVLTGCDHFPVLNRAHTAFDFAMFGQPDVPISRVDIDKLPYASIRAKMGRSGKVLMILGRYDGNDLHWISADNAVIATRNGRIVKTVGLKNDIRETRFPDPDPIALGAHKLTQPAIHIRLVDFLAEQHFSVIVKSVLQRTRRENITILEREYDTFVIREDNEVEQLGWSYTNVFWVDADTGFVWRSIQYFSPSLPPIEIDILKPAG